MIDTLTAPLRQHLVTNHGMAETASLTDAKSLVGELIAAGKIDAAKLKELGAIRDAADVKKEVGEMITKAVRDAISPGNQGGTGINTKSHGALADIMSGTDQIRVKNPSEKWSSQQVIAKHTKSGEPVMNNGQYVYSPSERDNAITGVFFKDYFRRNPNILSDIGLPVPTLREHEEELLKEMKASGRWSGTTPDGREVSGETLDGLGTHTKAILNDATSGGAYLIPEETDSVIHSNALLYGQLLPQVDIRNMARDTIEGASLGTISLTWGTAEGTGLTPFVTTSLFSQWSANAYPCACAIEIGLDTIADSVADIGATLNNELAMLLAKDLDDKICDGAGTSTPEGILQASGTGTVNSENGSTGPISIDDIETLMFSVPVQYRTNPAQRCCFIMNDTTYARIRALAVGTSDARRLFGMDHNSYKLFGYPVLINESAGNPELAFCAMRGYRLFRRAAASFKFETGGKTLSLASTGLLLMRARYAGLLVGTDGCAIMSDAMA